LQFVQDHGRKSLLNGFKNKEDKNVRFASKTNFEMKFKKLNKQTNLMF
jgi:hypothetical protein